MEYPKLRSDDLYRMIATGKISTTDFTILKILLRKAEKYNGYFIVRKSYKSLAKILNVNERTIGRSIKRFIATGCIIKLTQKLTFSIPIYLIVNPISINYNKELIIDFLSKSEIQYDINSIYN